MPTLCPYLTVPCRVRLQSVMVAFILFVSKIALMANFDMLKLNADFK